MAETSHNPPYFDAIVDDINARGDWNRIDDEIMKKRLGDRPARKNKPYRNAPNYTVDLIDEITTMKTDAEISMIMNAPEIALFIPLDGAPHEVTQRAQQGFNTYLRHYIDYRPKKEEAVDTKNCRGFAITKKVRREDDDLGVIPDFETVDPKDILVPADLKVDDINNCRRITHVMRYDVRQVREKKAAGWRNVDELLDRLGVTKQEGEEEVKRSSHDEDEVIKKTDQLIGINTSDLKQSKVVIWEVAHYATEWDVQHSGREDVKKGRKCMTYFCPDAPDIVLKVIPWKYPDEIGNLVETDPELAEQEIALAEVEEREPELIYTIQEGKDRPWPYIQHRYEYRTRYWYDSRGVGRLAMDNQLAATTLKNAKFTWLDYMAVPMFKATEGSRTYNQQSVRPRPGLRLPEGLDLAQMPQPPVNFDFDMDAERRSASQRVAAGSNMYSAQVSETRKLQMSATEAMQRSSQQSMVSSASVDRFNDPDRRLFKMLWEDMKELGVELPVVSSGEYQGQMTQDVYGYRFLIIPAASQKSLFPDEQFSKFMEAINFVAPFAQSVQMDLAGAMRYGVTQYDPNLSAALGLSGEGQNDAMDQRLAALEQGVAEVQQQTQMLDEDQDALLGLTEDNANLIDGGTGGRT